MQFDIKTLLIKQLPPTIYIKNFIDGHPANYEDFLIAFVNESKFVADKGNKKFTLRKHEEQNHGEADIFNNFYELDFKIMADTKYMEAKSMLSSSIIEISPGVTAIGPSRLKGKRKVYDIIKCFRFKTKETLMNIDNKSSKKPENKAIIHILKKASINKNILFFLPYDYCFENISTNIDVANCIIKCISEDLKGLFEYRNSKVCKDTYISFISKEYFIIAQEKNNVLCFYDMINTQNNNLYTYLYDIGRFK